MRKLISVLKYLLVTAWLLVLAATSLLAQPTISDFTPASGPVGTLVTITGTGLTSPTSLTIGGVPAIAVSNTGTSLVAMVMPGATSGSVGITTGSGSATASGTYSVTASLPPNTQLAPKLVGTGGVGETEQGYNVSLSADGKTALVGGPMDNSFTGAAWVYSRNGEVWTQQGAKLVGTGVVGPAQQGYSVALSADGNTAIVGGRFDNSQAGAAWVFARSNGVWSQQGPKLVGAGAVGSAHQGYSVALSADGNTALIGGYWDNGMGAVWVFIRSGGVWTQQGAKLVGTGALGSAEQGTSVALSADGNTALVGGSYDAFGKGAAWVFVRSGSFWSQQGAKLVGWGAFNNQVGPLQGNSVSLSADGNTALVGGPQENNREGAAWVFTRVGGIWTQLGEKLVGTGAVGLARQGNSVSINADGTIALVGGNNDYFGRGASWVFTRSGNEWTQQGSKLVGTGAVNGGEQGSSVALSADGLIAVVGGKYDNNRRGAAWVFVHVGPPTITDFSPTSGLPGTVVTIAGSNFIGTTAVSIGGMPATSFEVISSSTIAAVPAIGATGPIQVTTPQGLATSTSSFTYVSPPVPALTSFSPSSGPVGTLVTITGTNLDYLTGLSIGGAQAIVVSNDGNKLVAMVMPGATSGEVRIETHGGTAIATGSYSVSSVAIPREQLGPKLVGLTPSGAFDYAAQGQSVSLSADGKTALVGSPNADGRVGSARVYTRSTGVWKQQGPKLVGSGAVGQARQGYSVALSADGNTALVGGYGDNDDFGAVWVFTRNAGVWSQQGPKLVGSTDERRGYQGYSVALSADGNTALIGGPGDYFGLGAVWFFTRSSGVWSQQGLKLRDSFGVGFPKQGSSVALSADGNTALVGGPEAITGGPAQGLGACWVYTRTAGVWSQQGPRLVGSGPTGSAAQGHSVALSADGNTALFGGIEDNYDIGAVWVFTRNGGIWSQQGSKLVGSGAIGQAKQGSGVSISADGNTAFVGGYEDNDGIGATWIFSRTAGVWSQQGAKLVGTGASAPVFGGSYQGQSVFISADGTTAVVGGPNDNEFMGATWAFVSPRPAPIVASFAPTSGVTGTSVTIKGTNFAYASSVHFGGTAAISYQVIDDTTIIAIAPAASTGTIRVVTSPGSGTSLGTFTFIPSPPPILTSFAPRSGTVGTLVTVTGAHLYDLASLSIGGVQAVVVSNEGTSLVALVMPGSTTGAVSLSTQTGSTTASGNFSITANLLPNVQQGTILKGTGAIGSDCQELSVAISADGNTALIGGECYNNLKGAAWVFTRSGGMWSQQGPALRGTEGLGDARQGMSLAISADGNTALVGGTAVWVFTRNSGVWSQQGLKLVSTDASDGDGQGLSVSLSADGNTAIIGSDGYGAWVWTRYRGVWSQQGPKLVGIGTTSPPNIHDSGFGRSVSLSADGNTAAVGAPYFNGGAGAVWVFTRSAGNWSQQGPRLVGTGVSTYPFSASMANQGTSVSLSADGNTAIFGGPSDGYPFETVGSAWVFTRDAGVWSQQGSKLQGWSNSSLQGESVSISADGNTALVGGPGSSFLTGATWLWSRPLGYWTHQGNKLVGISPDEAWRQGCSVALSADGTTALIGSGRGAYVFFNGTTTSTEAEQAPTDAATLRLYPNPITRNQRLTLALPDRKTSARYTVEFIDLAGRVALTQHGELAAGSSESLLLSVSTLAPGSYAVRYTSGGTSTTGRVLVIE